jgi:selenocysteine lyase/cysteine desulfurase
VSSAAGIVAANLPPAKHGENVVVAENEFVSNYYPWLLLRERGYEVRAVAPGGDGVTAEAFGQAADGGTRLIAVSAVHSANGYRADLAALGRVAASSGAWFFVDACQAAGAVPLDVVPDGVDFLAAASHKFLLGSRGMGYLYVRSGLLDRLQPIGPGWKAARNPAESFYGPAMDLSPTASKLDASLAWFPALAEQAALGIFRRFGINALLERNARLALRLQEALAAEGSDFQPFTAQHRSTIVSVAVRDTEAVVARFRQANVVASVREGRIRLAVHFYNLDEELDRVAELIGRG